MSIRRRMRNCWNKWTYEIPLAIGDVLWDILVVQFANEQREAEKLDAHDGEPWTEMDIEASPSVYCQRFALANTLQ